MKQKSLGLNYIFNFISQIVTLIVPIIITPYISRIFKEVGNGQLAYVNTILSYFLMFANLGFAIYGQREISKSRDDKVKMSKVFYELFILRAFFSIISFFSLILLTYLNFFGEKYYLLLMILSIQIIAVIFDISFFFQGLEEFLYVAIKNIIFRSVLLVLIFIFVKDINDLWIYALLYSLSVVFSNLSMWPKLLNKLTKVDMKSLQLKKHILPVFLIFLPTLATTIYISLDKVMIINLAENGEFENGCYSQALVLNQTMLIAITVIDSIMNARNTYEYNQGNQDVVKKNVYFSSSYVLHIGLPMIVGICILCDNLSSWYLGDGYEVVPLLLQIMSVRFIFSGMACVFGNQFFISIGKEKYTTVAHCCTGLLNFILNLFFIPRFGAVGGAITTACSEFFDFLILAIMIRNEISLKIIIKKIWKPLFSSIVMGVPVFIMNMYLKYSVFSFLLETTIGVIVYFISLLFLKDSFVMEIIDRLKHTKLFISIFHRKKSG